MHRAIALFAIFTTCAFGAEKWTRLTTPHFELYTTAGEKKGRDTILYFEQVRSFFARLVPSNKKAAETPVRIVLFRSEAQFKPYAPNEVAAAYYTPGRYRDYIVMGDSDPEHLHIAIHEYMHLVIEHSGMKIPLWMNEGLADVYSTLKPMGKKAMIGDLMPGHLQALQTQKWMTFEALTQVNHQSQDYNEKKRAGIFYAESWALVHMLFLSPGYQEKFPQFLAAINSGKSATESCQAAFGRTAPEVYKDLQAYFSRNRLFGASFNISLAKSEEEAETSQIQTLDSEIVLADLLAAAGKRDLATEAYKRLAGENPNDPDIPRAMGYLAWQTNDREKALEQFEVSFSKGSRDPEMCYELAMFELEKDRASTKAIAALERALEVKPEYLEARLQLGLIQMNAQKYPAALETLLKIHKVNDEHAATLFNALAYTYMRTGNSEEARKHAQSALKWDRTDEDKRRTADLLRYLDSNSEQAQRKSPAGPAVSSDLGRPILAHRDEPAVSLPPVPVQPPVPKTERAEGIAKSMDCERKRFLIEAEGKVLAFDMPNPERIQIRHDGAEVFEFICGAQKPFHVVVEFVPAEKQGTGLRGSLRSLQF